MSLRQTEFRIEYNVRYIEPLIMAFENDFFLFTISFNLKSLCMYALLSPKTPT